MSIKTRKWQLSADDRMVEVTETTAAEVEVPEVADRVALAAPVGPNPTPTTMAAARVTADAGPLVIVQTLLRPAVITITGGLRLLGSVYLL